MNATYYEDYKHLMGLGQYDFYLSVTNLTGSQIEVNGRNFTAGKPLTVYEESVSAFRTAIFEDEIVRITFTIWK
jgi:hypothetical protein